MKQSTKDEIKGNLREAKGTVEEKVGQLTNNPNLTVKGQNDLLVDMTRTLFRAREGLVESRTGAVALVSRWHLARLSPRRLSPA